MPINLFCNIAVQILKIKTMKIQKRLNPVFEEVEIDLPVYRKTENVRCHFAKVFSENETLWVTVAGGISIGICSSSIAMESNYIDCTEAEFAEAYKEVQAKLNLLK